MTDADLLPMAEALKRCSFLPATNTKRAALDISGRVIDGLPLSRKQERYLYKLVVKFRRQIAGRHVTEAMRRLAAMPEEPPPPPPPAPPADPQGSLLT